MGVSWVCILEVIQSLLPCPVQLDPYLDASEDLLLTALEIYSQLQYVAVVEGIGLALHARCRQSNVVQERAAGALNILNEPLTVVAPELAVPPRHHLRTEADGSVRVVGVAFAGTADSNVFVLLSQAAFDRSKVQGLAVRAEVYVGREAYRRQRLVVGMKPRAGTIAVGSDHGG